MTFFLLFFSCVRGTITFFSLSRRKFSSAAPSHDSGDGGANIASTVAEGRPMWVEVIFCTYYYLHNSRILTDVITRVQSCKVSTAILRDARQPISQCLKTRNLASLSQCCETRNLVRILARNDQYFKHHPQYVQIFCKRVHPTILITYVQTYLPTCKLPLLVLRDKVCETIPWNREKIR